MDFLTRFSLRNISAILILCILVIFGGIQSSKVIRKESMPDINIPYVTVVTIYPGASPEDVLEGVTKPLETMVSSVSGIKDVNSTSSENVSTVVARFDYSSDMEEKAKKIGDAIKSAKLPENAQAPKVMKVDFSSSPILSVAISNGKVSSRNLEEMVRERIIPTLQGVDGAGQVALASESLKSIYVRLLPEKLKEFNLTSQTVTQMLQASNVSFPAGTISADGKVVPVRIMGKLKTIDDLKAVRFPIVPNTQDMMKSAFTQVGQGVSALGLAMGRMGQGMAGLGQAFNGQTKLLAAIQETQGKLTTLKMTMSEAKAVLANPQAPEDARQKAEATIGQLGFTADMLESALKQMRVKLAEVQGIVDKQITSSSDSMKAPAKASPAPSLVSGDTVALDEIAEVTIGTEKETSISRVNGNSGVLLQIIKNQDANTIEVAADMKKALESAKTLLPSGTRVDIISDQSESVKASVNGMLREGYIGALFAFIVILFFLRNIRTTIIACISIPLSILITLTFLKSMGITLNILTLGGLSVAIGRIVDDSIVVIENVYRHLQSGEKREGDTIRYAVREVSSAITSSTLTTVAVFIPMGLVSGLAGVLFKPFAATVSIALLSSLVVAVTVIPVLSKLLLMKGVKTEDVRESRFQKIYGRILGWSLDHKAATLGIAFTLLICSLLLLPKIGTSFMTEDKENFAGISLSYPPGTNLSTLNAKALEIERVLGRDSRILRYQTSLGATDGGNSRRSPNSGSILVEFVKDTDTDSAIASLRKNLMHLKGKAALEVSPASPNGTVGVSSINNFEVEVMGHNFETVKSSARLLTKELAKVEGVGDVSNTLAESKPEIAVSVDQEKASRYYLSAAQVGMHIRELLNTNAISKMVVDKKEMDIRLGLKLKDGTGVREIKDLPVTSPAGGTVKLSDIADVRVVPGPVSIFTTGGEEYARVTASIEGKDKGAATKRIQAMIKDLGLPEGISTKMGGVSEMMRDTFTQLGVAMVIAVFAVFFVMVVAMGELTAPLAILFSLPLAAIGGFTALFLSGLTMDMPAMIGSLMLIGIVVTNAIVLMDRVQQSRRNRVPLREALMEAGRIRMRPILMTAIATIAALVPIALGFSDGGAATSQSLAVMVIGGLTTSTFLTLVVVPVAYEMLYGIGQRIIRSDNEVGETL